MGNGMKSLLVVCYLLSAIYQLLSTNYYLPTTNYHPPIPMPELPENTLLNDERRALLRRIEDGLELPLLVLGVVWLGLLAAELIWDVQSVWMEVATWTIWAVFVFDFAVKFVLAPDKVDYLQKNWLNVISLVVPALRIFRFARAFRLVRAARAARGFRLVRLLGSLNRGMGALGDVMGRRGFGYVLALTLIVTFAGAAGMLAFEERAAGGGLDGYGQALWWTAMLMTTYGAGYEPVTIEGRVLAFVLALYAFTVFGYVTATLATFFIGRDAQNPEAELPNAAMIDELREEIRALRVELRAPTGGVKWTTSPMKLPEI